MNFLARLGSLCAIANSGVQRMGAAVKVNIRPEQRTSSYCDQAGIDEDAIDIDEHAFADLDVEPIIH